MNEPRATGPPPLPHQRSTAEPAPVPEEPAPAAGGESEGGDPEPAVNEEAAAWEPADPSASGTPPAGRTSRPAWGLLIFFGVWAAMATGFAIWQMREVSVLRHQLGASLKRSAQYEAEAHAVGSRLEKAANRQAETIVELEKSKVEQYETEATLRELQSRLLTLTQERLRQARQPRFPLEMERLITVQGQVFTNVTVKSIEGDQIEIVHTDGAGYLPLSQLTPESRTALGLPPTP